MSFCVACSPAIQLDRCLLHFVVGRVFDSVSRSSPLPFLALESPLFGVTVRGILRHASVMGRVVNMLRSTPANSTINFRALVAYNIVIGFGKFTVLSKTFHL